MEKIKFDLEQIEAIYNEADSRIAHLYEEGYLTDSVPELEHDMEVFTQGIYAVLYAMADNWPEVRSRISMVEYFHLRLPD